MLADHLFRLNRVCVEPLRLIDKRLQIVTLVVWLNRDVYQIDFEALFLTRLEWLCLQALIFRDLLSAAV